MMARSASEDALRAYGREPGRSASVVVQLPDGEWRGGIHEDVLRPAASVMKLALAIAAENRMRSEALPVVTIDRLLASYDGPSVLRSLDPGRELVAGELLSLCLAASDNPSAAWLLDHIGLPAVEQALFDSGCLTATAEATNDGLLSGALSSREALRLLEACLARPLSARALGNSILNSRIPLGAERADIAHKTGTLLGVAHDVARIQCAGGTVWLAFLTADQHDTLVTGYDMGICTRELLMAWGLDASSTLSVG